MLKYFRNKLSCYDEQSVFEKRGPTSILTYARHELD